MKLKIISNGVAIGGTHVVNAETGERVEGVTRVVWVADVHGRVAKARVSLINVPVEVECDAELKPDALRST